jgi:AcrR family transcriptional regulator
MASLSISGKKTLQSKKQEVVRQEIWNSAIELFHATSFDNVTVDQIARRAGISSRSFFRYFSSKEDVLGSAVRAYGRALADAISIADRDLPQIKVSKQAILKVLEPHLAATERVVHIAKQSASARSAHLHQTPIVQQELERAFAARMQREGTYSIDHSILANLTLFATTLSIEIWVDYRHRPFAEIVEEVFARFSAVCVASHHAAKH